MIKKVQAFALVCFCSTILPGCITTPDETKNELNSQTACVNLRYEIQSLRTRPSKDTSISNANKIVPVKRLEELQRQYVARGCEDNFPIE